MSERTSSYRWPDSLYGALLAIEGIRGAAAVLNAPTGCKFAPAHLAELQDPRHDGADPAEYGGEFFFGQARIPCTYLDEQDYVCGGGEKLVRLLRTVAERGPRLIGVVNGPGAALVGEDLGRAVRAADLRVPVLCIDAGLNGPASLGHAVALERMIDGLTASDRPARRPPLALCGGSLLSLRWRDDLRQLRSELSLAGLDDVCNLGPGSNTEELRRAAAAEVIAVMHESHGARLASRLAKRTGAKLVGEEVLSPIGIQAAEAWLLAVAGASGGDLTAIRSRTRDVRAELYVALSRFAARSGLPAGLRFVVAADAAVAAPLALFLTDHLGMVPAAVLLRERAPAAERFIDAFARERSLELMVFTEGSVLDEAETYRRLEPDILFGSSQDRSVATSALQRALPFVAVSLPETGRVLLTPRPLMGLGGALVLTEEILNAVVPLSRSALC
ncbi:MAG: hypothetical protein HYZ28_25725 [Myxococcales bacterium]|nr:hypothetical protein [Myxococcales bacterium]